MLLEVDLDGFVCDDGLSPLELSLRWRPGFTALLHTGVGSRERALELALLIGSLEPVTELLADGTDIFAGDILCCALEATDECQTLVVASLAERFRRNVATSDRQKEDDDVLDLPVTSGPPHHVSRRLWGAQGLPGRPFSHQNQCSPLSFFDKLYEAGFKDLDAISGLIADATPLLHHLTIFLESEDQRRGATSLELALWLMKKGATQHFSGEQLWPNMLFYLAMAFCPCTLSEPSDICNRFDLLTELTRVSADICNPLRRDSCRCWCSRNGCLCSSMLLRYHASLHALRRSSPLTHCPTRASLDRRFFMWMRLCGLTRGERQDCIEDAVRLEIFERLGLAHTCCSARFQTLGSLRYVGRRPTPHEQRQDLQDDDAELSLQLELMMAAFQTFQWRFCGSDQEMLAKWWAELEGILPGFQPRERCVERPTPEMLERRSTLERNALEKSGYGDMDFMDVIKKHFGEYLPSENFTAIDNFLHS